jgi:hypothetical protein
MLMELPPPRTASQYDNGDDDSDTVVGVGKVEPDLQFLRKCGCWDVLALLTGKK